MIFFIFGQISLCKIPKIPKIKKKNDFKILNFGGGAQPPENRKIQVFEVFSFPGISYGLI